MALGRRRPWLAATLSLLGVGVGHLYCGRLARGLAFLAMCQVGPAACVAAVVLPPSDTVFWIAAAAAIVVPPVVVLLAAADAWRIARQSAVGSDGGRDEPKACQRPAVYALSIVTIFVAGVVAMLVVRRTLLEAFAIPSSSMEPTLHRGDRFLVNRLRFSLQPVQRGDVVAYDSREERATFVKRVIGLPGDVVEGIDGVVFVNHEPLPLGSVPDDPDVRSERIGDRAHLVRPGGDFPPTTVPAGAYFVVGDHRSASRDSRHSGPVAAAAIRGRVEYVYLAGGDGRRVGALDR